MRDPFPPSPVLRLDAPRKAERPTLKSDAQHLANVTEIKVRKPAGLTDEQWAAQIRSTMMNRGVIHLCPGSDAPLEGLGRVDSLRYEGTHLVAEIVLNETGRSVMCELQAPSRRSPIDFGTDDPRAFHLNTLARADGILAQRIDAL